MALTNKDRKLFDRLNKRFKNFKKQGVVNNTWGMAINEVMNIYADLDMRGVDTSNIGGINQNIFSMSKNLDDEAVKALRKVAEFLDETESSKIGYYKKNKDIDDRVFKAYRTMLDRPDNNINSLQDYIDMIDDMQQSKEIKGLREAMSSDMIMRTYDYARTLGLKNDEVEEIIINGLKTTLQGDPLYNWMRGEIKKAYDEKYYNQ